MVKDIYGVQMHWVIVPVANSRKWLLTLTGIVSIDFESPTDQWKEETFNLLIDLTDPLVFAKGNPPSGQIWAFNTQLWAPLASLNSIKEMGDSVFMRIERGAEYAVNSCEPILGGDKFRGLQVTAVVRHGILYRIGCQVTLVGTIVTETIVL